MSESPEREWRFYLDDMIGFAEKVIAYTQGFDQAAFVTHGLTYDATVRTLEWIGEAASHIPDGGRQAKSAPRSRKCSTAFRKASRSNRL